ERALPSAHDAPPSASMSTAVSRRSDRRRARSRAASELHADLTHEAEHVVEEVLLDDPPIAPVRHGAEVDLEALARRREATSVREHELALHRAAPARDRAGPRAAREQDLVG